MRLRTALSLSVLSAAFGAGLVACFDLFHSTSRILDSCELDSATCVEAGTNFCSWDSGTAYANAGTACAWLEACETPIDHHDFGDCMLRALLAYDCSASSAHPTGPTQQMWDALWQARSCDDVKRVVFSPGGVVQSCPAGRTGFACLQNGGDGGYATELYCLDGGVAAAENCTLWNQTCDPTSPRCAGCLGCYPDDGDAGPCTPDTSATCDGGVATSCPAGTPVSIDCDELLQQSGGCNQGTLSTPKDPTSACYVDAGSPASDAGGDAEAGAPTSGCTESCSGTMITGCAHGVTYTFDCAAIGATCQSVQSPDQVTHGAACAFSD